MDSRYLYRVFDKDQNCYLQPIEKDVCCEDGTEFTFFGFIDGRKRAVEIRSLHYCMNHEWFIVEQCTGLSAVKSYRGTRPEDLMIWEGDKIQTTDSKGQPIVKIIKYISTKAAFCMANEYELKYDDWDIWQQIRVDWLTEFEAEIIGTVHDSEVKK